MKKIIFVLVLALWSAVVVFALGYGNKMSYGFYDMQKYPFLFPALWIWMLLLLFVGRKKIFWTIFAVTALTALLYFPVGLIYGPLDESMVGSFIEADIQVDKEFFGFVPGHIWLIGAGLALLTLGIIVTARRLLPFRLPDRLFLAFLTIMGTLFVYDGIRFAQNLREGKSFSDWNFPLIHFYVNAYQAPARYFAAKKVYMSQILRDDTWHVGEVRPKYRNYVLVLGESARKDYHHVYGFPVKNTPFLSSSPGLFIDGFLSPSFVTMRTWPSMLAMDGNLNNSIVTLVNKAGFRSVWLSNQGMGGYLAKELTGIAWNSREVYYTQRGSYFNSILIDDRTLLPRFKNIVESPHDKPNFIVMHLMGSHMDFCDRVHNAPSSLRYLNRSLTCYVQSIWQSDQIIAEAVKILRARGEPWSLIYVGDHGLVHSSRNPQTVTMIHEQRYRQSFMVPFVRISSDDTAHEVRKLERSGFDLLLGLTQWLGIETEELRDRSAQFDFFDGPTDPDAMIWRYGKKEPFRNLVDDDPPLSSSP